MKRPYLSPQQKLALAMTSAGSQRHLASVIGITHQRLGRWLKGETAIPEEAAGAIDTAFKLHREVSKDQARADKIPFSDAVPVYGYRPALQEKFDHKGRPVKSDRIFVPRTQFMDSDLRKGALAEFHLSGKIHSVSIRSTINWYNYITANKPTTHDRYEPMNDGSVLYHPLDTAKPDIIIEQVEFPIFSKKESFQRKSITGTLNAVERSIEGKHKKHAVDGKFADQFLIQLLPEDWQHGETRFDRKPSAVARGTRKNKRGK